MPPDRQPTTGPDEHLGFGSASADQAGRRVHSRRVVAPRTGASSTTTCLLRRPLGATVPRHPPANGLRIRHEGGDDRGLSALRRRAHGRPLGATHAERPRRDLAGPVALLAVAQHPEHVDRGGPVGRIAQAGPDVHRRCQPLQRLGYNRIADRLCGTPGLPLRTSTGFQFSFQVAMFSGSHGAAQIAAAPVVSSFSSDLSRVHTARIGPS